MMDEQVNLSLPLAVKLAEDVLCVDVASIQTYR